MNNSAAEQVVSVTEKALEVIVEHLQQDGRTDLGARLEVTGKSSSGFHYSFNFIEKSGVQEDDKVIDLPGLFLYIDPKSAEQLQGSTVDFVVNEYGGGGFQVDNPNPIWTDPASLELQELIDTQINPGIASHGGWIELLEVNEDKAYIRLGGGCQGCGMADVTLKQGIEVLIKDKMPAISLVVDTTDHAAGSNPYYSPGKGAP